MVSPNLSDPDSPAAKPMAITRSIVIIDNSKIRMYPQLEDMVHAQGALLFSLPSYSPQLNPIELGFRLMTEAKRCVSISLRCDTHNAIAMVKCKEQKPDGPTNMYSRCGCDSNNV
ncbi:TPA: LOW QUALITY PROTEIN: hypothetical protein N0F65_010289 [Lagenidium giganteum]|uniref:Tc1-like transposase DDE domain-containing protein n=1 Tax=Lagenidium giganteum TaxID=4803 RepID=A0AAV2YPT0_9STRA|nr:TPA: LOW QUALITY PROTEIN: hypothetical protein N0F65_010288 [Lagenidium giganteum]DAZ95787.1 TPA: LOW QUALITY PROTEIN: hypothetical protein N0F65_010289 [Lagenidium giganteum]